MAKKRVVLTGAAGYVSQRMFAELSQRYDLVPIDIKETFADGRKVPGVHLCDLTNPDRAAYRKLFRGADCVVHNGFVVTRDLNATTWNNNSEAKFRMEYQNVGMAYNIFQAALEEQVPRVVMTSSNHAADYYERLIWSDRWDVVTPDMAPKSDNFYGWAKIAYEALGFVYASGKVGGRKLQVVQVRIGAPRDSDFDTPPADRKELYRAMGAYLSQRDQVQLYVCSIETEDIEDENGVPFLAVYGISGNSHNFWSLANARAKLGYQPQDDSLVKFGDAILKAVKR
ncbi:MAG TPA: NAD(P)-dependent oxidoreductase [bacterium]|nr:NAD(P)-dependent oxidoreductase [bacterium]